VNHTDPTGHSQYHMLPYPGGIFSNGKGHPHDITSGGCVTLLQQQLIKRGYSCGSDGADGHFGDATTAAVKQFQRDHGLGVDGRVGEKTWYELYWLGPVFVPVVDEPSDATSDKSLYTAPSYQSGALSFMDSVAAYIYTLLQAAKLINIMGSVSFPLLITPTLSIMYSATSFRAQGWGDNITFLRTLWNGRNHRTVR